MREERRRKGKVGKLDQKLAVDPAMMDPAYRYRWANDNELRVQNLEANDWDIVDARDPLKDRDGRSGLGSAVSKVVGRNDDGSPKKAYLMRKRRDWYDADKAERQAEINKQETAIKNPEGLEGQGYGEVKIAR